MLSKSPEPGPGTGHLHWTWDRPSSAGTGTGLKDRPTFDQGQALPLVSFTNSVMTSLPQSFRPNTKLPIHFKVCLAKLLKFYVFLAMSNDVKSHEPGPGTGPPALDLGQAHLHWILDRSQGQAHLGPGTGPPDGPTWASIGHHLGLCRASLGPRRHHLGPTWDSVAPPGLP